MYVRLSVGVFECVWMYVCICVYGCLSDTVSLYVYQIECVCVYVCVNVCMSDCVCVYMCVWLDSFSNSIECLFCSLAQTVIVCLYLLVFP
jgi:hypothetical protein